MGPSSASRPLHLPSLDLPEQYSAVTSASVRAEFKIAADGSFTVTLLQATGTPDLDRYILGLLEKARWSPRKIAGVAVADVRTVDLVLER